MKPVRQIGVDATAVHQPPFGSVEGRSGVHVDLKAAGGAKCPQISDVSALQIPGVEALRLPPSGSFERLVRRRSAVIIVATSHVRRSPRSLSPGLDDDHAWTPARPAAPPPHTASVPFGQAWRAADRSLRRVQRIGRGDRGRPAELGGRTNPPWRNMSVGARRARERPRVWSRRSRSAGTSSTRSCCPRSSTGSSRWAARSRSASARSVPVASIPAMPGSRSARRPRTSSTRSSATWSSTAPRPSIPRMRTSCRPTSRGPSPRTFTARPTSTPRSGSAAAGSTWPTRRWIAASPSTSPPGRRGAWPMTDVDARHADRRRACGGPGPPARAAPRQRACSAS